MPQRNLQTANQMAQRNKGVSPTRRNTVRLIGGRWRHRLLHFPSIDGLRPTADAVRERLFNWLGQDLTGWHCLDLFAGSGALGFEAASRGAVQVVMVERNRTAYQALEVNRQQLDAVMVQTICADGIAWLQQCKLTEAFAGFNLVLLDPPFALSLHTAALTHIQSLLAPSAFVYVEHDGTLQLPEDWAVWREGRSGLAHYCLLRPTI